MHLVHQFPRRHLRRHAVARRPQQSAAAFALAASLGLSATPADADVSSWAFVGTGPSVIDRGETDSQLMLQLDAGLGTPPTSAFVFGGVFNMQTHFGRGSDLGVSFRSTTRGFSLGDWGGGVDLGLYQRWWEEESTGGIAKLLLGGPWGVTLSSGVSYGTNEHRAFSAVLGIDFARLTVYRTSGLDWFSNPYPVPGAE